MSVTNRSQIELSDTQVERSAAKDGLQIINLDLVEIKSRESEAQEISRLESERVEAAHTRWKERVTFMCAIGVGLSALAGCAYALFAGALNESDKRWIQSVITFIIGALFARAFK